MISIINQITHNSNNPRKKHISRTIRIRNVRPKLEKTPNMTAIQLSPKKINKAHILRKKVHTYTGWSTAPTTSTVQLIMKTKMTTMKIVMDQHHVAVSLCLHALLINGIINQSVPNGIVNSRDIKSTDLRCSLAARTKTISDCLLKIISNHLHSQS